MRNLFFVLITLFSWATFASTETIVGSLQKEANKYFMKLSEGDQSFTLVPSSQDALENLSKLSPGDLVTGTGVIDTEKMQILLSTVDYVGIKRFLGTWHSAEGLFEITSFERMNFYPYVIETRQQHADKPVVSITEPQLYKYSMTPSQGREWVMFMSDTKSTIFTTIQINGDSAKIKFYDSETGKMTKSLRLTKWRLN